MLVETFELTDTTLEDSVQFCVKPPGSFDSFVSEEEFPSTF